MGKIIAWIVIIVIIVWGIFALTGNNDSADIVPPANEAAAVGTADTGTETDASVIDETATGTADIPTDDTGATDTSDEAKTE
ncbi:MAG: hypothetical protein COW88_03205 [Candidatus Lloydbacteria bacterium CG22_combo_CG10-13_8_21_14_all_47_15]|uniref:Uncharacterized protein n=1 Tax=Candidatus Lloydbacteria bacterium CG22_combo_CG10-13_8_21_14_all_47_15 TaxID=1974635 RepID=A0A2H0CUI6_9BACT|nr:MAG: hypothetical protein COW88_03205 [Candidatus Lloydbacteria bacterium CG22_combo_CG10-13_8_21_14_all_47_15]